MKKTSLIGFILGISAHCYAQFGHDVRVIREDARSAVIEFVPNFLGTLPNEEQNQRDVRLNFFGALAEYSEPGDPLILYRAVNVMLPSRRHSLQVITSEQRDLSGVRPALIPSLKSEELGFVRVPERVIKTTTTTRDNGIVELSDVGPFQEGFQGTLKFFPVHYDLRGGSA
ncbi:MAG: hypothetical protein ACRDGA_06355, partial [Bacteroidota bacterium]